MTEATETGPPVPAAGRPARWMGHVTDPVAVVGLGGPVLTDVSRKQLLLRDFQVVGG